MTGATGKHTGAGPAESLRPAGDRGMTAAVPVLVITGPVTVDGAEKLPESAGGVKTPLS